MSFLAGQCVYIMFYILPMLRRHTHPTDCSTWTTEVIGNKYLKMAISCRVVGLSTNIGGLSERPSRLLTGNMAHGSS